MTPGHVTYVEKYLITEIPHMKKNATGVKLVILTYVNNAITDTRA